MKPSSLILQLLMASLALSYTANTFAFDQIAKEEMTPPAAEGALNTAQIPPMYTDKKASPQANNSETQTESLTNSPS
jgi:hypothetical protein